MSGGTTSRPRRSRRARIRNALIALTAVVACVVAAGFPLYVMPQLEPIRKVDAIVVLGGYGYERYSEGIELGLEGIAPVVVMSNPDGAEDEWLTDLCTHQRYTFTIECFVPDPATTRGEAQEIGRLWHERHWSSIMVLTIRPHVSRARAIIERCYGGTLLMVDTPADIGLSYWIRSYAYQTAGYIRAALQSGC